jgi:hypothetical protein
VYYQVVGNPGSGLLEFLPKYKRNYVSVEFILGTNELRRFNFFTSYVLSQNKGNYTGFFDQDFLEALPGANLGLQVAEQAPNSYGYLPNDHRHTFKFSASYRFKFGLTAGTSFWMMSGAPLNELGQTKFGLKRFSYLVERGTAGRLPTIWDFSIRLSYNLRISSTQSKLFLDVLHIGNPRRAVIKDQIRFLDLDLRENPNYGNVIQYQPPTMVRIGLSVDF